MKKGDTVLVTGGAGFIGSALVRHLILKHDCQVTVLDKLTYAGHQENLEAVQDSNLLRFIRGDVTDQSVVKDVIAKVQPSIIYHLAAESHVDRSIDGPSVFLETNVIGTFNLVTNALAYWTDLDGKRKSAFRLIHVSTDEVFGSLGPSGHFTEESRYQPNSPYAASKASADHFARAWQRTYGLPVIITNCSNNYGPNQLPEKLIPLAILNALEGRNIPVYGDGQQVRDWIYVDDHVDGLVVAAVKGRPGEVYCFGGSYELSNLSVVEQICDLVDARKSGPTATKALISHVDDRPGHDARYAISNEKVIRDLGWSPKTDFTDGLAKTVDWYIENRTWWEPLRHHSEERLGQRAKPQR